LKASCNNYKQARLVFDKMMKEKIIPDNYSYSALIKSALNNTNKSSGLSEAILILEQSISRNSKMHLTSLSTSFLFNPIMNECVKQERYDVLDMLVTTLERLKIPPDLHTYTIMLTAASNRDDKNMLMDILSEMLNNKDLKSISHVCWRVLTSISGRSSDANGLLEILNQIRNTRKELVTMFMWRDLIGLYGRNGNCKAAEQSLTEMKKLDGLEPDQSCFIRVIRSYATIGNYKKAHQMVKDMRSRNVAVDSDVWGYILSSCAKNHENVSELFNLLQEFISQDGYFPSSNVWSLIVNSYISRQKYNDDNSNKHNNDDNNNKVITKEMKISSELDLISSFLAYCPYSSIRKTFIKKIVLEILEKNIHVDNDNDEVYVAEKFLLGLAKEVKIKYLNAAVDDVVEGFQELFFYLSKAQSSISNDRILMIISNMIEEGINPSKDMLILSSQVEIKKLLLEGHIEAAEQCAVKRIKAFKDDKNDKDTIQNFIESVYTPIVQYYLRNRKYRNLEKLLDFIHQDVELNRYWGVTFYGTLISEVLKEACHQNR